MKYLVIFAHPNPTSFNSAVRDVIVAELKNAGGEVMVRDLYAIGFKPELGPGDLVALQQGGVLDDVRSEQEYIRQAGVMILVYPLWWAGMPAILKGYIDRVFSHGFAYRITETGAEGLLTGKKVFLVTTTGATQEIYEERGMFRSLRQTVDDGIFGFSGMELIEHLYLTGVPYVTETDRREMLERLRVFVKEYLVF